MIFIRALILIVIYVPFLNAQVLFPEDSWKTHFNLKDIKRLQFYNDIVLRQPIASASMRADKNMKYRKTVKVHQNVLVFCKGNPKEVFA